MGKPAFFLDRDGTINVDPGYLRDPSALELLPGVASAIRRARDAGFAIVVVTNQSGVGRGLIPPEVLPQIHERLNELLRQEAGAVVDHYACCLHSPAEQCDCRKPRPKLVFESSAQLGLDLGRSVFVGDRLTDIQTGKNAGCAWTVLVRSGEGRDQEALLGAESQAPFEEGPDHVADDLAGAVDWVLGRQSR
jgi:histidinol-phosphate phosphatase family protein